MRTPGDEQATSLRKELDAAANEEAKPQDKPKQRKKARKKPERPIEETGVTARVYELPDGRRITVIRRSAENSPDGRPPPAYYPGRPGYYQY